MGFVKKYKRELITAGFLLGLYLLLRLVALTQLPIFTDEAIYLRWAQIAKNDANWRFISLTDGKQPFFIWLVMLSMRFVSDPLVAGRIVSVGAGLCSMLGLFFLGREAFKSRWVGLISSALYVVFPFSLVYDRLALYDSLVGTFAIWGLYFTIVLVRRAQLDRALLMGFVTGAAVLNKTSGFFTIYLLPFALVIFDFRQKYAKVKLFRLTGLAILVVAMTYGFYSILRLSPFFYIINEKNALFVYPLSEWMKHPFTFFLSNLRALCDWYLRYVGLPMTIVMLGSIFVSRHFTREKALAMLWFVLPFIALALMGNTLYPRYILFMTLPLLPLAAFTLVKLYKKLSLKVSLTVYFLAVIYWLIADLLILTYFAGSPIPQSDKSQYLTGWPAGVGVKEATAFFMQEAKKGPIYIGTEGTFGLMPYALELSLVDNPNVTIKGFWPISELPPVDLTVAALKKPTYVLFYQDCVLCKGTGVAPESWHLQKVLQVKRIEPGSYLTVYRVLPQ